MNRALVDNIARAVLYEGYILYPYRKSAKNRHRFTFGTLLPRDYAATAQTGEPATMQTELLLDAPPDANIHLELRFLHLVERTPINATGRPVDRLEVEGQIHESWQEALEQSLPLDFPLNDPPSETPFTLPGETTTELLPQGHALRRTRAELRILLTARPTPLPHNLTKLTVTITNITPASTRDLALPRALASTHLLLHTNQGQFLSLIDPPPHAAELAKSCNNLHAWPVLVGNPGDTDAVLAAPIILYDHPQLAPESPGDLFDGTEIDEILSLRILTLTDEEKAQARSLDPRAASLLNRTESLARQQLQKLHGTMRSPRTVDVVHVANAELRAGDRVRLKPRKGADAMDMFLANKIATIAKIEQDYENRIHLAVTIDEDPGKDIGQAGLIAHRFFFKPEEVEPLQEATPA